VEVTTVLQVYKILSSMLSNFEQQLSVTSKFIPNLLRFRRNPNICRGVYDDDVLVGTFLLQSYREKRNDKLIKILRIERPLVITNLTYKKRLEIFGTMKRYVVQLAISLSYDFIEMELYKSINEDIYFPSSLSTLGTFNLPEDYDCLVDNSFKEIKKTLCFEIIKEKKQEYIETRQRSLFDRLRKRFYGWCICDPKSMTVRKAIPFFAFNFPEYFLVRTEPKPAMIQWYPDLFLLSKDNWRLLFDEEDEVRRRILNIQRGKIYRIVGFSMDDFLPQIETILEANPFSDISQLQLFSDARYLNIIKSFNAQMVHSLIRLRKTVL
jgi:hypothetical protein